MNAIDLVVWVLVLWLVARVVITDDPRLWLPVGLVAGLGLLNKINVLLLDLGLVVGLLATPLRRFDDPRNPHWCASRSWQRSRPQAWVVVFFVIRRAAATIV